MRKGIGLLLLAGLVGAVCLALNDRPSTIGMYGLVSSAQARVDRPLTPVSVAGVARRTARRCVAGMYYC